MPDLVETLDCSWVKANIRTTTFSAKDYEKLQKENGISEKSQLSSDKRNELGDKLREEF